jgi:large subunit ribosomal protein L16
MLMPKRTKYRKQMRGRMTGKAYRGSDISFGEIGLQSLEPAWITSRQIESSRRAITNYLKRGGKVWIRVFPDKPITAKPAETRMGSGKGNPEFWVAVVKPGRIMFELGGVNEALGRSALERAIQKLPIRARVVVRAHQEEVEVE